MLLGVDYNQIGDGRIYDVFDMISLGCLYRHISYDQPLSQRIDCQSLRVQESQGRTTS